MLFDKHEVISLSSLGTPSDLALQPHILCDAKRRIQLFVRVVLIVASAWHLVLEHLLQKQKRNVKQEATFVLSCSSQRQKQFTVKTMRAVFLRCAVTATK
jgi:hypothetical protein